MDLATVAKLFRDQSVLSVSDTLSIIHEAQELLNAEPNTVHIQAYDAIYVFGDIHGQFFDLLHLIENVGLENLATKDIRLIFLGDYVDRGVFSCEVILYLLLLKLRFPTKVILLRGNHECETLTSFYGFRQECRIKYGLSVYYHFVACFQALPLAALLTSADGTNRILCVHGGLSPDITHLHEIDAIDRHREVPIEGPLCDLLWADPSEQSDGDTQWTTNKVRGCSYYFSASVLFTFLETNHLSAVIRAHEYEETGYLFHYSTDDYDVLDTRSDRSVPPLITVFSAANYCDTNRNKAGYLIIQMDPLKIQVQQIESVGHPIPALVSIERSADIWRQFRQTLPFLPASKDFFEEVLYLSKQERKRSSSSTPSIEVVLPIEEKEQGSHSSARRRRTNEMHPHAIRRVLDEEATKWMQSEEDNSELATAYPTPPHLVEENDKFKKTNSNTQYRSLSLEPPEVDMMKLMFSLLDTDGSMTLNATKVSQFVFNILGEGISPKAAETYLEALDFDRNGVVDFADILSWAAVMKANHTREYESIMSLSFIMRRIRSLLRTVDPYRCFLWLTVMYIVRDVVILKRVRLLRSRSLGTLIIAALALYTMDIVRLCRQLQLNRWCTLFPVWQLLARWRQREMREDEEM